MNLRFLVSVCVMIIITQSLPSLPAGERDVQKPSPGEALDLLKKGNERFYCGNATHPRSDEARLKLAGSENQGDYAYATVITCSDSRVPVERIFDAGVMDIFVIRVAGNVCGADEIGSIEYGLAHVKTPVFVMLGHTQCGAVTAAAHEVQGTGHPLEKNIQPLVDDIVPAVKKAMESHPDMHDDAIIPAAIEQNMWLGIEHLFRESPTVRKLVREGKVKAVAAIYDVGTGKVRWLPDEQVDAIFAKVEARNEE